MGEPVRFAERVRETGGMETCWRNRLNLVEMAENCECEHPVETYEARVGTRCRCCFGLVTLEHSDGDARQEQEWRNAYYDPFDPLHIDGPLLCENCGKTMAEHGRLAECWPALNDGPVPSVTPVVGNDPDESSQEISA